MGSEESGHRVFNQRDCSSILDHSISDNVAEISMCSGSMFQSPNGIDPFYSSGWDTVIPGNQTGNFLGNSSMLHQNEFAVNNNPHYPIVMDNQTMGLVHFASDSGLVDLMPKIPSFGSGEMVNSTFGRIDESSGRSNFHQIPTVNSQEHHQNPEDDRALNGKRKRKVPMGASSCKSVEVEEQKDQNGNNSEFPKEDEKKHMDTNSSRSKQAAKQAKDNSDGGSEASKEDYILVRAKRGQATNSHSLAERVRRERISERMRLLQELVPGCNKITGKAVMLDEIINYVQSLQQQVEFLSMKLATVNPELNVDIDRILSKDLLHQRGSNATELGIGPGLSLSRAFPQGIINGFSGTAPQFHPLPQNLWNNELQSILQMGLDSSPSGSSLGPNGLSKMEL